MAAKQQGGAIQNQPGAGTLPVAAVEEYRRRHQRQNNDIIRVNALYATRLRLAETEKKDLLGENMELRAEIARLAALYDEAAADAKQSHGQMQRMAAAQRALREKLAMLVKLGDELHHCVGHFRTQVLGLYQETHDGAATPADAGAAPGQLPAWRRHGAAAVFPAASAGALSMRPPRPAHARAFAPSLSPIHEVAESAALSSSSSSDEFLEMDLVSFSPIPHTATPSPASSPAASPVSRKALPALTPVSAPVSPPPPTRATAPLVRQRQSPALTRLSPPSSSPVQRPALASANARGVPGGLFNHVTPTKSTRGHLRRPETAVGATSKLQSPPSSPPRAAAPLPPASESRAGRRPRPSYQLPSLRQKLRQGMEHTISADNPYGLPAFSTPRTNPPASARPTGTASARLTGASTRG